MLNTCARSCMSRRGLAWQALVLVSCLAGGLDVLLAHDMWIEPSTFTLEPGKPLAVRLRVGVDLVGDPVPRDPALLERFIAVDANGTMPIAGSDGVDPAGVMPAGGPGLMILGYASKPSSIVLTPEKFNSYLAEEGLEPIAALRAQRKQTAADAREAFTRCAKALVLSGSPTSSQGDRVLGFTLELVAERNPYTLGPGADFPVRLTYRGQPLEGALVVAINKRNPSSKLSARSKKDGRATFRLTEPGMWLIKAVHMTTAAADSGAEWASFWASLTFQLPPVRVAAYLSPSAAAGSAW